MDARGDLLRRSRITRARVGAGRLEVDLKLNLAHSQAPGRNQCAEQRLDAALGLQPPVDRHRLAEDALELVDVPEERPSVLLLDVKQEVLVAGVAHQRGVPMAVRDELERLGAAHLLVAGLEIDLLILLAVRRVDVVVAPIDRRVHASDLVDRGLEVVEVDLDDVVGSDPGELVDRRDEGVEATAGKGVVQAGGHGAVRTRDRGLELSRDRHHRDPRLVRVDPDEQHLVGVREDRGGGRVVALVVADKQDRLRVAEAGRRQRAGRELDRVVETQILGERLDLALD